jgi:hypothetical protein
MIAERGHDSKKRVEKNGKRGKAILHQNSLIDRLTLQRETER